MRAIAVLPGKPYSIHLAELPKPSVREIPNGRGVLVQVGRVGLDGTDKEINAAEYGQAPSSYDFLVIGHECFGRVLEVGLNVTGFGERVQAVAQSRSSGGVGRPVYLDERSVDPKLQNALAHSISCLRRPAIHSWHLMPWNVSARTACWCWQA